MDLAPGSTLGSATLIERIGRGGMGEVWRAERVGPGGVRRRVAVKRLLTQYQTAPSLRERFVAEARITARLEHPNVVQLIEFGDAPELFLVLEYVPGVSLDTALRRAAETNAPFPLPAALYIAAEVAEGLDYAHRLVDERGQPLGVVHRDVSPQNVLLSVEGAVKIGDFGVARAADNVLRTRAGVGVGKPAYMAPEQALGGPIDRRADVFSLGVVLWEMLTLRGLLPRESPEAAAEARVRGQFPPPSRVVPQLPPALDALVLEALAPDPNARTPSAGRMAAALRAMLHGVAPGYGPRELAAYLAALFPEHAQRGSTAPRTVGMPAVSLPPPALVSSHPGPASASAWQPQPTALSAMPVPYSSGTVPVTAPPSLGATVPPATYGAVASRAAPPPPARRHVVELTAPQLLALFVGALLVLAVLGAGAVLFARERMASSSPEAARTSGGGAGAFGGLFAPSRARQQAAYRTALGQSLAGIARGCAAWRVPRAPVGVAREVTADLAYGPGGALRSAAVRVRGAGEADAAVAACVDDMLRRMPALGPTASDLVLDGLSATF